MSKLAGAASGRKGPAGAVDVDVRLLRRARRDWLTAKRALESAEQAEKGNSHRARRDDLARWALVIAEAKGHSSTDDAPPMARLRLGDLSEEVLVAAVAEAKRR